MAVEVVFAPNPIQVQDPGLASEFEKVVSEALRQHDEESDPGPVHVRFQVWQEEETRRYVCKVECASRMMIDCSEPPWRWWSPLVTAPAELAQELRTAIRTQQVKRGAGAPRRRPEAAPVAVVAAERWGWDHATR